MLENVFIEPDIPVTILLDMANLMSSSTVSPKTDLERAESLSSYINIKLYSASVFLLNLMYFMLFPNNKVILVRWLRLTLLFDLVITTLNLISQYIYTNCFKSVLSVLLILLLILSANTGLRLMESVNDGSLPSIFLLQLLSLKIIQYSSLIIPISLFFGVLVSLNRFYITNEMVIMKLGGYSSKLISNVLSKIIIGTSLIVMLFNFFITPYAIDNRLRIEHQVLHEQKIYILAEGRFNHSADNSKVVYISNKNKSEPGNIFIKSENDDSTRIDISSRIIPSEDAVVYLKDGINYIFNSENGLSSTSYNEQNFLLSNAIPNKVNNNIEAKSIIELLASDNASALIEALQRISMIIATFVLGYLAIPLSHTNEREDKYKNIFIGILFYFSYIILINLLSNYFSNISYAIIGFINLHLFFAYITYQLFKYSQR